MSNIHPMTSTQIARAGASMQTLYRQPGPSLSETFVTAVDDSSFNHSETATMPRQ